MLRKDLKSILLEDSPQRSVAMSSIAMLAKEISSKKGFLDEAHQFLKSYDYGLLVILGSNVSRISGNLVDFAILHKKQDLKQIYLGQFERDILIYPASPGSYGEFLANTMANEGNLELTKIETEIQDYVLLNQKNTSFGRKVWLPVVSDLLNNSSKK